MAQIINLDGRFQRLHSISSMNGGAFCVNSGKSVRFYECSNSLIGQHFEQ
jgi:hypothetical protein